MNVLLFCEQLIFATKHNYVYIPVDSVVIVTIENVVLVIIEN